MSIDWWTLGIQSVNVLILAWLLSRFFWRPVAGIIMVRQAEAKGLLDDAEAKRVAAEAALAAANKMRSALAAEREAFLKDARAEAAREAETLLTKARAEIDKAHAASEAQLQRERTEADKAWAQRAGALAISIAQRLARRLGGPAIRSTFVDWLVAEVNSLSPAARATLLAPDARLEAVSAVPLPPMEQEDYRNRIAAAIGAERPIDFMVDPSLIAGLEIRAPHLVVSNSWSADLKKILAEVQRGDQG